jgi:hypothetical protein
MKANMLKQKCYELEIVCLGEDINDLQLVASRLLNLVGQPADGINYDFSIMDITEDRCMEVEDQVHTGLVPGVGKLEATSGDLEKDIWSLKKNIGAHVTERLQKLEALVQSFELALSIGSRLDMTKFRMVVINKVMPTMQDLWNLYICNQGAWTCC